MNNVDADVCKVTIAGDVYWAAHALNTTLQLVQQLGGQVLGESEVDIDDGNNVVPGSIIIPDDGNEVLLRGGAYTPDGKNRALTTEIVVSAEVPRGFGFAFSKGIEGVFGGARDSDVRDDAKRPRVKVGAVVVNAEYV
jgi:hypothetical protein